MTKPSISVVLIEDDKQIRRFVRTELALRDMTVTEATTGREGLQAAATRKPDLLIVDLGLPDIDGLDVIRQIRTWADMPLIVLSARSREAEKVAAFEAGADDYLTKPFGVGELTARIHALLRRRNRVGEAGAQQVRFGEVVLDLAARSVTRAGRHLHLTPVEFRLLTTLVRNAGRVMTHGQLLTQVWGPAHAEDTHYLRVYMGNLRQKLERDPAQPAHLVTETGVGYRLAGVE
ncbi:response regulator [Robbsia sp. Bb-Pol-6]|uniref:Response regulator n=1 Tax=Robbsia betulipollinis TaxID=2981849 RepID=A0ABT3ZJS0_9BURK|nr:response regulator [Robbsia betulipollinis]MCY0386697.1 response regulator [Robbsia betulipollinis]